MSLKRRAPGQRLRRSRRVFEMEQLELRDPEKYAEMVELRRLSPQMFRKELVRLIKKGAIVKGRSYAIAGGDADFLDGDDIDAIMREADARVESGDADFRFMAGLEQQERMGRARPDLIAFFNRRYTELLDADGRRIM